MATSLALFRHADIQVDMGARRVASPDGPANFFIAAEQTSVSNYARKGNDLIIKFADGRETRIEQFFEHGADYHNLVFVHDGSWVASFDQALNASGDGILDRLVTYDPIDDSVATVALLGLLGAGAAGTYYATRQDDDSGGGHSAGAGPSARVPTASVTISGATDNVAPVLQMLRNGAATNDTSPVLAGTLSAPLANGEYVEVLRDGVVIGRAEVSVTNWGFQDSGLADGKTYHYTVRVAGGVGNVGGVSSEFTITVDTTAPTQVVRIGSMHDNTGAVQGVIANGGTSDESLPELRGSLSAALGEGEVVAIYRDGVRVGEATVSGSGWTYADSGLVNGLHNYTARVEDAAGNAGEYSPQYGFTLQAAGPGIVAAIAKVTDDTAPVTGAIPNKGHTNDSSPTLSGTLTAWLGTGDVLAVYRNGERVGTAKVSGPNWTFTDTGLSDGEYSYTAAVENRQGAHGVLSGIHTITVDTVSPVQTVAITEAFDNMDPVTGPIANGGTTNDSTPELRGTLSAPLTGTEKVHVFRDGVDVGTADVKGTAWTFTDGGLSSGGSYLYTVRVVDAAGNTGAASNDWKITLDTSGGTQTTSILSVEGDRPDSGQVPNHGWTNDGTPTVTGALFARLASGEKVQVLRDGVVVGTATVDGASWTFTDSGVRDGEHTYTARVMGATGTPGGISNAYVINVDATAPEQTVAVSGYTDDQPANTGRFGYDVMTNDTSPLLDGTISSALAKGEAVVVYRDGVKLGEAVVTGTDWTFQDAGLADGDYAYTARVEDIAGNVGADSAQVTLMVEAMAPQQTVRISGYVDGQVPKTGSFGFTVPTNDTAPELEGTISSALAGNEAVIVYRDGIRVGEATVTDDTKWTFKDSGLADGEYEYTARVEDSVGNAGADSALVKLTVDTVAPTAAVLIASITDNMPAVLGMVPHGGSTNDTSPLLSGTLSRVLEKNETVEILRDGVVVGTAAVNDTTWTYSDSGLSGGKAYTYTARVADAAGNVGGTASEYMISVDTTPPAQTARITAIYDNVGAVRGVVVNGGTTDDSLPELRGSLSATLGMGEVVAIYRDGMRVGEAKVSDASWSFTDSGLGNGLHVYTVAVEDAAGNAGTTSPAYSLVVQTVGPSTSATIGAITDNTAPVTGTVPNGGHTNDVSPSLSGSLTAWLGGGEVLSIYRDGVKAGTARVSGTSWTFTDASVGDGEHWYTAVVENGQGVQGSVSNIYTVTVDSAPPVQAVAITQVLGNMDPGAGSIADGGRTNDATPELHGTLSAQLSATEAVHVFRDGVYAGTALVNGTSWTFTDGDLSSGGSYTYTAQVVDAAGNSGAASNTWTVSLDTSGGVQTTTILRVEDDRAPDTDLVARHGWTNDNTPTVVGTLFASLASDETVQVLRDGVVVGVAKVNGVNWTFTDSDVSDGQHSYTAQVVNAAGTPGGSSDAYVINVDATAPQQTAIISGYTDDQAPRTGSFGFSVPTNDTSPMLEGAITSVLAGNEVVAIYRDGVKVGDATVMGTAWTFQDSGLSEGSHSYLARVEDPVNAGVQSAGVALTVDTTAPTAAVVIASITDNVDPVQGAVPNGGSTNDTSPVLSGTLSALLAGGEVVEILRNGQEVGFATVNDTTWTFAETDLANGETYTYTARVVDAAGNVGGASSGYVLHTEPVQTVAMHTTGFSTDDGADAAHAAGFAHGEAFLATLTDGAHGHDGAGAAADSTYWASSGGLHATDYSHAGDLPITVNLSLADAQDTQFGAASFSGVESIAGAGGDDVFRGNAADNFFEGRGGADVFHLHDGGHDTLLYKLLNSVDATGGNGHDTVHGWSMGTGDASGETDRIDLSGLLVGYQGDADGAMHHAAGHPGAGAGETISDYISVTQHGADTIISIDRDGAGAAFAMTELVTLKDTTTDLETLLANHQIVV
jgi:hypothetical protein